MLIREVILNISVVLDVWEMYNRSLAKENYGTKVYAPKSFVKSLIIRAS